MRIVTTFFLFALGFGAIWFEAAAAVQKSSITIRTENFPRPPYSGATYYIYERDGEVICTKLEVCNKYDDCDRTYKKVLSRKMKTSKPVSRMAGRNRCSYRRINSGSTFA